MSMNGVASFVHPSCNVARLATFGSPSWLIDSGASVNMAGKSCFLL